MDLSKPAEAGPLTHIFAEAGLLTCPEHNKLAEVGPLTHPEHMNLIAYIDGGSRGNPGPAAAAFVVTDKTGHVIAEKGSFLGRRTNNEAEYRALIELLAWLGGHPKLCKTARDTVQVRCDSLLLVSQVTGKWKVKEPRLKELHRWVQELKRRQPFRLYIRHIPREKNKLADRIVNAALNKASVK